MAQCKGKTKKGKRCKRKAAEGSDFCAQHSKEMALTPRQEQFCQLFVSKEFFGNGVQSYIEAYDINVSKKGAYDGARTDASRLLTKANICNRINELLDEAGLNDNFVDKQLLFMITQNADFSSKIAAIREYNKLKARITDRIEDVTKEPKRLVLVEKGK